MINRKLIPIINQFLAIRDKTVRENVGYQQAKKIGILYSYPNRAKSNAILSLITEISKDDKTTVVICLLDAEGFGRSQSKENFGEHQIKLFGSWANPIVPEFCEQKFDYLLHLDTSVNPLIENILLKSSALCRIGLYNESHNHLFEMMIKTADDSDQSLQMMEIYRYLKQLR